jgi:sporulation protein YlmC with PRC-barrel domain
MNNEVDMKKQIILIGTVAALSAFAPCLTAADDVEVKADVDVPKVNTRTEVKRDRDVTVKADADANRTSRDRVLKSNKASGIIGMEVRNKENQKLGEVKDLVMDMNTGRLSYAVLSVGGFLGVGEKLIALPPGAMKVAGDGEYLLLEADKSKIQAAPGFAATAWPAPGDPEIHRFWTDIRATGSPARTETSRSRDLDVDVKGDVDKGKAKVNVDTDRKNKIYTDADGDKKVKVEVEKD